MVTDGTFNLLQRTRCFSKLSAYELWISKWVLLITAFLICSLKPATQGLDFPTLLAAVSFTNKIVFSLQGSGGAPPSVQTSKVTQTLYG